MANLRHRYPWLVEGRGRPLNRALYERLVEAARDQRPISIWELGDLLGLAMDYPPQRTEMSQLLGIITRHEVANGRPMLSSVVIDDAEAVPGKELFDIGEDLGLVERGEDPLRFSVRQQQETFALWSADEAPGLDEALKGRAQGGGRQLTARIPPALAARWAAAHGQPPLSRSPVDVPPLGESAPVAAAPAGRILRSANALRPSTGLTRLVEQAASQPAERPTRPADEHATRPAEERAKPAQRIESEAAPASESDLPERPREPTPVPIVVPARPQAESRTVQDAAVRWVMQLERAAGRQPVDRREDPTFPGDLESGPRTIVVRALPGGSGDAALTLDATQFAEARRNPTFHVYVVEDTRHGDPTLFTLKVLGGTALRELLGRAWERHYFEMRWPAAHHDATPGLEALPDPATPPEAPTAR